MPLRSKYQMSRMTANEVYDAIHKAREEGFEAGYVAGRDKYKNRHKDCDCKHCEDNRPVW